MIGDLLRNEIKPLLAVTVMFWTIATIAYASPSSICDGISGNLVMNCGFETGDLTDWTLSGNTSSAFARTGSFRGFAPNSGSYYAFLGPAGSDGFMTQTLATIPGQDYIISWYLGSVGGAPNDFSAIWDGTVIFSATDLPSAGGLYNFYRNDPGFQALDDVSVVAASTPEPSSLLLLATALCSAAIALRRGLNAWRTSIRVGSEE